MNKPDTSRQASALYYDNSGVFRFDFQTNESHKVISSRGLAKRIYPFLIKTSPDLSKAVFLEKKTYDLVLVDLKTKTKYIVMKGAIGHKNETIHNYNVHFEFLWSSDSNILYFFKIEEDKTTLHIINTDTGVLLETKKYPELYFPLHYLPEDKIVFQNSVYSADSCGILDLNTDQVLSFSKSPHASLRKVVPLSPNVYILIYVQHKFPDDGQIINKESHVVGVEKITIKKESTVTKEHYLIPKTLRYFSSFKRIVPVACSNKYALLGVVPEGRQLTSTQFSAFLTLDFESGKITTQIKLHSNTPSQLGWRFFHDPMSPKHTFYCFNVTSHDPLIVIDPEDRKRITRINYTNWLTPELQDLLIRRNGHAVPQSVYNNSGYLEIYLDVFPGINLDGHDLSGYYKISEKHKRTDRIADITPFQRACELLLRKTRFK